MKLLLILLLGAAVQCPNKEIFISRIKELDITIQHSIVELIKQVTDNQSLVLTSDSLEQLEPQQMFTHLIRLSKERDKVHFFYLISFPLVCFSFDKYNFFNFSIIPIGPNIYLWNQIYY